MPSTKTPLQPVAQTSCASVLLLLVLSGCLHDLRGECLASGNASEHQNWRATCEAALRYDEKDPEIIARIARQDFMENKTDEAWRLIDKLAIQKDDDERKLTASVLGLIGVYLYWSERYQEAANLQEQAVALFKQRPAHRKPDAAIVSNLYNLALTYYVFGRLEQAIALVTESMQRFDNMEQTAAELKKLFFGKFPDRAQWPASRPGRFVKLHMLNLRAGLHEVNRDLVSAKADFQEAFKIAGMLANQSGNPLLLSLADSANNLARINLKMGASADARKLAERALFIRRQRYSNDHLEIMRSLQTLAQIDIAEMNFPEARRNLKDAGNIANKYLNGSSIEVASLIQNQAMTLLATNDLDSAFEAFSRSLRIQSQRFRFLLSQAEILNVADVFQSQKQLLFGLPLALPRQSRFRELALRTAALHKGQTLDAIAQVGKLNRLLAQDGSLNDQIGYLKDLQQKQQNELSKEDQHPQRLAELSEQIDRESNRLARQVDGNRVSFLPPHDEIVRALAGRLDARSTLLDVELAVVPTELSAAGLSPDQPKHYVALLLFPDQRIEVVDLGPAQAVDAAVSTFLAAMQSPTSLAENAAKALYQQVLAPLRGLLDETEHVYLSLDGSLSMVPFSALHDGSRYLVHAFRFSYLTSPRDLLRPRMQRSQQPPLLLADPDSRAGWTAASLPSEKLHSARSRLAQTLAALPSLPGTVREVTALARHLNVSPFVGATARKELLLQAQAPWLVHVASHGLLLSEDGDHVAQPQDMPRRSHIVPVLMTASPAGWPPPGRVLSLPEGINELSRAVLVLAGAAEGVLQGKPEHNGLLSALDAHQLNLQGTQLVVLSACGTGRGAVSLGQGIYGLRRGILAAGAETLLTSQWAVADNATAELMSSFYDRLLDPELPLSRLSALQRAMLDTKQRYPHPHYWAPFILVGEDSPISLPRR